MIEITKEEAVEAILREGLKLNEIPEEDLEYFNGDIIQEVYSYYNTDGIIQPEGYTIEEEEQFGGEGQGDNYFIVVSIKENNSGEKIYVRFNGYYDSWNGTEWDGWDFVKPIEVTVTKWEAIPND
jgi:hypothetical protein